MAVNTAVMTRKYSVRNLSFTYFLCSDCRLMYVSKRLIRDQVSDWRKSDPRITVHHKKIMDEVFGFLKEITAYHEKIGYEVTFRMRKK